MRILIVDDHEVVRVGLASVLRDVPDFEVVAMVATAEEALRETERLHPDVVVLDLRLPDRPGTAIVGELRERCPGVKIVVLTSYGHDRAVVAAAAVGVDAFLTKTADSSALVEAIRSVVAGRPVLQDRATGALLRYVRAMEQGAVPLATTLTARELEVARWVAEGLSNREVAERLHVSEKTVKNHVSEILSKLDLSRRGQIVRLFGALSEDDFPLRAP